MPTYYVSPTGSNANGGLSGNDANAWQTVAYALSHTVNGDTILLKAGSTFAENGLTVPVSLTIGAFGAGAKPIVQTTGSDAIVAADVGNVTFDGIKVVGAYTSGGLGSGITFYNTSTGNTQQPNCVVRNCEMSGFYNGGVCFYSATAGTTSGYSNALVEDNYIHDCKGFGVWFSDSAHAGRSARNPNPIIRRNRIEDITGIVNTNSGFPIYVLFATDGLIEHNTVTRAGSLAGNTGGGGPAGILIAFSARVTARHNEASFVTDTSAGIDGIGFDFDLNCQDCVFEFNYSHDNRGAGFYAYAQDSGNIMRFNLSVNDARGNGGSLRVWDSGSAVSMYHNTVIATSGTRPLLLSTNPNACKALNNIFVQAGNSTGPIVDVTAPTTLEGNSYYRSGGVSYKVGASTYTGLPALRTGASKEVGHGFESDPRVDIPATWPTFTDGTTISAYARFKVPAGSVAENAGLDVTAYGLTLGAADFNGTATDSSTNLGAFNSTRSVLAAVTAPVPSVTVTSLNFSITWANTDSIKDEISIDGGAWIDCGKALAYASTGGNGTHQVRTRTTNADYAVSSPSSPVSFTLTELTNVSTTIASGLSGTQGQNGWRFGLVNSGTVNPATFSTAGLTYGTGAYGPQWLGADLYSTPFLAAGYASPAYTSGKGPAYEFTSPISGNLTVTMSGQALQGGNGSDLSVWVNNTKVGASLALLYPNAAASLTVTGAVANGDKIYIIQDGKGANGSDIITIAATIGIVHVNTGSVTSVTASPATATLYGGQQQQFFSSVLGIGDFSTAVGWTATAGSINSSGLFTAPGGLASGAQTITVTATSTQNSAKSGIVTITVPAHAPSSGINGNAILGQFGF